MVMKKMLQVGAEVNGRENRLETLPGTSFLDPKLHNDLTEHLVRRWITVVFPDRFSFLEPSLWAKRQL